MKESTAYSALRALQEEKLSRLVAGLPFLTLEEEAQRLDSLLHLPLLEGVAQKIVTHQTAHAFVDAQRYQELKRTLA